MRPSTRSRSAAAPVADQGNPDSVEQPTDENNENVFEAETMKEKKPQRHRITRSQLERLEALYKENSHPTRQIKQSLASEVGLPVRNVTIWFQNKRQNVRRKSTRFKERAERDSVAGPDILDCARSAKLLIGLTPDPPSSREDSPVAAETAPRRPMQGLGLIDMSVHASGPAARGGSSSRVRANAPVQDLWSYLPSSPLTPTLVHSSVDSVNLSMLLPEDDVFGPVIASGFRGSGRKPRLDWACAREEKRFRTSACRSPGASTRLGDSSTGSETDSRGYLSFSEAQQRQDDVGKSTSVMEAGIHTDSPLLPEYCSLFPLDMLEGASILLSLKHTGLRA